MVLSQYGRDLISKKPKQKSPTKNSFTTKKQTMVSKEEVSEMIDFAINQHNSCLLYTSPSPRDRQKSRMPSSA